MGEASAIEEDGGNRRYDEKKALSKAIFWPFWKRNRRDPSSQALKKSKLSHRGPGLPFLGPWLILVGSWANVCSIQRMLLSYWESRPLAGPALPPWWPAIKISIFPDLGGVLGQQEDTRNAPKEAIEQPHHTVLASSNSGNQQKEKVSEKRRFFSKSFSNPLPLSILPRG